MTGAVAAVWAISVATYHFIYEYFDRRYGEEARTMAGWDGDNAGFQPARVVRMLWRVRGNERTFRGIRNAGVLAVLSITISVAALAFGSEEVFPVAVLTFLAAILAFLWAFTIEINTSVSQMHDFDRDIRSRPP